MEPLFASIIVLLLTFSFTRGMRHSDVSYEELEKLDATCNYRDSCKLPRSSDTLQKYNCNCGPFCSDVGTCCIDSPHRRKPKKGMMSCKAVYRNEGYSSYFMVDNCPSGGNGNIFSKFCEDEEDEDLMSIVPVTSLSSNVTYKNYFCFRCHEAGDAYHYWNVKLSSLSKLNDEDTNKNVFVTYNAVNRSWMAPLGKDGDFVPVSLGIEIPKDIETVPLYCILNVISNCSDKWQTNSIRLKCNAYTSVVHFSKNGPSLSYRNPHCALCNFEDLEKMLCALHTSVRTGIKKPFSFTHLMDINRSDGDIVGKIQKCDENSVWDPFFNKCRALRCALPGYVIQSGKCILP